MRAAGQVVFGPISDRTLPCEPWCSHGMVLQALGAIVAVIGFGAPPGTIRQ